MRILFEHPALNGRLPWASTETSTDHAGHIEGALAAGERAARAVRATPGHSAAADRAGGAPFTVLCKADRRRGNWLVAGTGGDAMRDAYHEELDAIGTSLVDMAQLVGSAMGQATTALLDGDLALAQRVIAGDEEINALQHALEDRAIALLARQQPVATDLRIVVTSLRMSADLERSGDLAKHVAKLAQLRAPERAVPDDLHSTILEMGQLAQRLMAKTADVLATRDVDTALTMEQDDDRIDTLHRTLFQHLLDERWRHGVETAVDVTLAGRYYERFADHAVAVANRVVYLVTGEHADSLTPPEVSPINQP